MILYVRQKKRDKDVNNRVLDYVGEDEGGTIWENSIETCILTYVIYMTRASLMDEAGHSKLVLWTTQRDEVWREVGGVVKMGGYMCTHAWLMSIYGQSCYKNIVK